MGGFLSGIRNALKRGWQMAPPDEDMARTPPFVPRGIVRPPIESDGGYPTGVGAQSRPRPRSVDSMDENEDRLRGYQDVITAVPERRNPGWLRRIASIVPGAIDNAMPSSQPGESLQDRFLYGNFERDVADWNRKKQAAKGAADIEDDILRRRATQANIESLNASRQATNEESRRRTEEQAKTARDKTDEGFRKDIENRTSNLARPLADNEQVPQGWEEQKSPSGARWAVPSEDDVRKARSRAGRTERYSPQMIQNLNLAARANFERMKKDGHYPTDAMYQDVEIDQDGMYSKAEIDSLNRLAGRTDQATSGIMSRDSRADIAALLNAGKNARANDAPRATPAQFRSVEAKKQRALAEAEELHRSQDPLKQISIEELNRRKQQIQNAYEEEIESLGGSAEHVQFGSTPSAPPAAPPPPQPVQAASADQPPPEALASIQPGQRVTFKNGQTWAKDASGNAKRVR